ncbi:MAG: ATP-binding protein [Spirochaetota bacterium]
MEPQKYRGSGDGPGAQALPESGGSSRGTDLARLSRRISRKIDRAIFAYRLIEPGDRILLGISGGKDSLTLLKQLSMKAGAFSIPFEVAAVHVHTEFSPQWLPDRLAEIAEKWGVPFRTVPLNLQRRIRTGHRMNCWWCSTQRRTELLRVAREEGFSKIALGHHLDDILETFIMNLTHKGELSTMLPKMSYDKYEEDIIRPLAWVEESEIEEFVRLSGLEAASCVCGYDAASKRKRVRRIVEEIVAVEGPGARERMMRALHNPKLRYLMGD